MKANKKSQKLSPLVEIAENLQSVSSPLKRTVLGPDVQSIVSLMSSLMTNLLMVVAKVF